MARKVFPDDRLTYALAGVEWLAGVPVPGLVGIPPGTVMSVFTDAAGTIPADVLHADGSAVTLSSPLVVDAYSRVPLFQGPADGTDTLYAVVAGGVPSAVYARVDDRLDAVQAATVGLGLADEASALAGPTAGVSGFTEVVVASAPDRTGLYIHGAADTGYKDEIRVDDVDGALILGVGNFGGMIITDQMKIARSVSGEPQQWFDIYGYRIQNGLAEFAWPGPPGNILSFADSCQEVFESSRAATAGGWQVAFGAAGTPVAETGLPSGSGYAVELTSPGSSMSAGTAPGVFAYPVTAGGIYSAVIHAKAVATARSPQVGMQWWTSGASFISTTVGSTAATNTSTYTKLTSGSLTAPAGAAWGAPCVVWPTTVAGEKHRISAAAVYASVQTEFSPPFVCQPYPLGGQAAAGAIWRRSSTPTDPEGRLYICTTGGVPAAQVWQPMGTAQLSTSTPAAVATAGAVGTGTTNARSDHAHAGVVVDKQVFTSTAGGTWTKPAAGTIAIIDVIPGGGGGGAGRRGAAGTIRGGGAGGGAGGRIASIILPLSALGATETVTVGAGGTAGAAATVNSTDGGAGGAGGNSSFGNWLTAVGGSGGGGGTATGATGGNGGWGDTFSASGANSSATGAAGTGANSGYSSPAAGASGGGVTSGDAVSAGGGGAGVGMRNYTGSGAAGSAGSNGGAATSVTAGVPLPGASGGGGGSSITGVGGNGAAGALYGAGGSGGGASLNGNNSGAGGAGAQGIVQVVVI